MKTPMVKFARVAWIENNAGFVISLLGAWGKSVPLVAVLPFHEVLKFRNVRWHGRAHFDAGREE